MRLDQSDMKIYITQISLIIIHDNLQILVQVRIASKKQANTCEKEMETKQLPKNREDNQLEGKMCQKKMGLQPSKGSYFLNILWIFLLNETRAHSSKAKRTYVPLIKNRRKRLSCRIWLILKIVQNLMLNILKTHARFIHRQIRHNKEDIYWMVTFLYVYPQH